VERFFGFGVLVPVLLAIASCAAPGVMTARNSTLPVELGPVPCVGCEPRPRDLRSAQKAPPAIQGQVTNEREFSTASSGYMQTSQSSWQVEGANKFDVVVLKAVGECQRCRAVVDVVPVQSSCLLALFWYLDRNRLSIRGEVLEAPADPEPPAFQPAPEPEPPPQPVKPARSRKKGGRK